MSKPTTEAQQKLGMVAISRASMQALNDAALAADTITLSRLANGSALITLEGSAEIQQHLKEKILECDDPEAMAALSNAYANIAKSVASTLKVAGCMPQAQPEGAKRVRKSFAAAPPIDVNSKT